MDIHADLDGFYYSWDECGWLGINCKRVEEKILFTNTACMYLFKQKGFTLMVRPIP